MAVMTILKKITYVVVDQATTITSIVQAKDSFPPFNLENGI